MRSSVQGRCRPVGGQRVVGRVVVGCLGGRVGRVLVVDRIVSRRRGRLALLVSMAGGCALRGACRAWLARRRGLGVVVAVIVVVVVVVNNNNLPRNAVLVEVGPVGIAPPLSRAGVGCAHVDRGRLCDGWQLGWLLLSCVRGCGSAQV